MSASIPAHNYKPVKTKDECEHEWQFTATQYGISGAFDPKRMTMTHTSIVATARIYECKHCKVTRKESL